MAKHFKRSRKCKVRKLIRDSHLRWAHQQAAINYSSPPDRSATATAYAEGEAALLVPDGMIRVSNPSGSWLARDLDDEGGE